MTARIAPKSGKDMYFKKQNEKDLVATFDYNYPLITKFDQEVKFFSLLMIPYIGQLSLIGYFCCEQHNIRDNSYAQHVCVTRYGIKHVTEKRNTGCRMQCQQKEKVERFIPFNKITACDVEEPHGTAVCCFVEKVLTHVNIDVASTAPGSHEMVLRGLKDPEGFKRLVWSMKRGENILSSSNGDDEATVNVMQRLGERERVAYLA